jgi:hypothetical protein
VLGAVAGGFYYAAATDLAATMPALAFPVAPTAVVTPPVAPLAMRSFPATANPAVMLKSGQTYGPVWIDGAYRAMRHGAKLPIGDVVVDGLKVTNAVRDGIQICLASNVTIKNFSIEHGPIANTGTDLPEGIAVGGSASCGSNVTSLVIQDGRISGFRMAKEYDSLGRAIYTNGDGIATEGGTSGIIARVTSANNTDGGFDLKGSWVLNDTAAVANSRSYRFWGDITATTITSTNPGGAHVWINAKAAQTIVIDKLVARSNTTAPILRIENGFPISITIRECDLHVPAGTVFLLNAGGNKSALTLGPGCKL